MAIEKRFKEMLRNNTREIQSFYDEELRNLFQDKLDTSAEEAIDEKHKKAREALDAKKQKIQDKIEKLRNEIDELDPEYKVLSDNIKSSIVRIQDEDVEDELKDFMRSTLNIRHEYDNVTGNYTYKQSDVEASKEVYGSSVYQNSKKFQMIEKNVTNTMELCATSKEARSVLISFQNKNWRAIGVNLPFLNITNEFDIDDNGNIEMDTSRLLEAPVKKAIN
jgi:hypothetical protein